MNNHIRALSSLFLISIAAPAFSTSALPGTTGAWCPYNPVTRKGCKNLGGQEGAAEQNAPMIAAGGAHSTPALPPMASSGIQDGSAGVAEGLSAVPSATAGVFAGIDVMSGVPLHRYKDFDHRSNGVFGLTLERTYIDNSAQYTSNTQGRTAMGPTWLHNFEVRLEWLTDTVGTNPALRTETGAQIQSRKIGSVWRMDPAVMAATLVKTDAGMFDGGEIFKLSVGDGDAFYGFDGYGYLVYLRDRNGNQLSLTYGVGSGASKLLTRVAAGAPDHRYLSFEYYAPTNLSDLKTSRLKKVTGSWNGRFTEYLYHSTSGKLEFVKDGWGRTVQKFSEDLPSWDPLGEGVRFFAVQQPDGVGILKTVSTSKFDAFSGSGGILGKYDGQGTVIASRENSGGLWRSGSGEAVSAGGDGSHSYVPPAVSYYDFTDPGLAVHVRSDSQSLEASPFTGAQNSSWILNDETVGGVEVASFTYTAPYNATDPWDYGSTKVFKQERIGKPATYNFYVESGNGKGRPSGIWKSNDEWTSYTYDNKGNVATITGPDNQLTSYVVDAYGRLKSTTDGLGTTEYGHDNRGNVVWTKDREGRFTFSQYDARNMLIASGKGESGTTSTYTYDAYDRLWKVTDPANTVVAQYGYGSNDRMVSVNTPAGFTSYNYSETSFTLTTVNMPGGVTINYEYDIFGNVTKVTDERGKSTTYAYDYKGRLKNETNPLNKTASVTYEDSAGCGSCGGGGGVGKPKTTTSFAGIQRTFTYDEAGRMKKVEWNGTSDQVELGYNSKGRLETSTDTRLPMADLGGQTFTYGYNPKGQLTSITYPDGEVLAYDYDQHGRRAWMDDPDGNTTNNYYTAGAPAGTRLSLVYHSLLGGISYNYGTDGLLGSYGYPNYRENGFLYDSQKRLSGIEIVNPDTSANLHTETYTYNTASVRTRIDVTGSGVSSSRMEYGYDSMLRLTDEYRFTGSTQNWGRKYAYDAAGNRTSLARHNGSTTTSIIYDPANDWNQIPLDSEHESVYDDDGNLIARAGDGPRYFEHDREGRLTATTRWGTTVRYAYDSSGRMLLRVAANGSKEKYYYDGLTRVLVKELPSGGSVWRTKRVYAVKPGAIGQVYGERENTAWSTGGTPTAWTDRWLHYDMLGNLVIKTDEYGEVTDRYQMDAYGNVLSGNPNGIHLTTKERDPDTGLYWFGARWYDPATGRWLQPEPAGADGPNLYWFGNSSPTTGVDVNGLSVTLMPSADDEPTIRTRRRGYSPAGQKMRTDPAANSCPPTPPPTTCPNAEFCYEGKAPLHGNNDCYREVVPLSKGLIAPGRQCCYENGQLVQHGPGAGTFDLIAPANGVDSNGDCDNSLLLRVPLHIIADVLPFILEGP